MGPYEEVRVNLRCYYSDAVHFFFIGFSLVWSTPRLSWLASSLSISSLALGITSMCHLMGVACGAQTHVLELAKQALYKLGHLHSPKTLF